MNLSKIICINDSYPIGFVKEGDKFKIDQGLIIEKYTVNLNSEFECHPPNNFTLASYAISIDGLDYSPKDFMVFEDWRNEKIDKIIND
jgi:hypothetical protein